MKWLKNARGKLCSVEDLLIKIGMHEHISVFVLNGYEDLELFKEIEPADLDYLGIINPDHRAKILSAVQLLHDLDSGSEGDIAGSSSEGDDHTRGLNLGITGNCSPFGRRQFPRDSGCYDASMKSTRIQQHGNDSDTNEKNVFPDNTNNLDSIVQHCSNEILARVKQAQNIGNKKDDQGYHPNIPPQSPLTPNIANSPSTEKLPSRVAFDTFTRNQLMDQHARRSNLANRSSGRKVSSSNITATLLEDSCEADQKLTMVKYVVGGSTDLGLGCESGNTASSLGRGGCLSEKSSDSGVSSSSLSSTNPRQQSNKIDSPTRTFVSSNNCRASPTKAGDMK
ncbi:SAM and SH3 domain-containing protein 1-like [Chrysoperla carnea]|uniref:SAM and SH3 domain-containing protein 1-like n=1 Tax=Chrysoperla carnea TaxID=189513 RepID=UPI001D08B58E|nr:SAM and SH3 domain-containing protein 1-like [Chrysoperla carnea]